LIDVIEGQRVDALLSDGARCRGVNFTELGELQARAVILATGGAAALWQRTTNPAGSIGRGIVVAHSAGAAVADLEMIQFHPTALCAGGSADGLLVTEAIRGEGAILVDADGRRFVDELAPRDEVALAIYERMIESGADSVALDMRSVDPKLFPNVVESLQKVGINATSELIPVAPAAHYAMGGIESDLHGQTTLPGLFAVGECACTGLHGANRLASNSLTECFVFGRRAALAALDQPGASKATAAPAFAPGPVIPSDETRNALWNLAGLVRESDGLSRLLDDPHPLARLVAASALAREETRGAHRRSDFPEADPKLDGFRTSLASGKAAQMIAWEPQSGPLETEVRAPQLP
jgi:L-aspartate oxidase